jgi:hypothetical protein
MIFGYDVHDKVTDRHTRIEFSDIMLLDTVPEALFSPQEFYRIRPYPDEVIGH